MEAEWILGAIVAGVIVWLVTLLLVWLDMRREKEKSWRWLAVTGLVPIIGYIIYLIATRAKSPKGGTRLTSRTEKAPEFEFLDENNNLITIKPGTEASGIQNAKDILNDALLDRASDVHIEPSGKEYRVRFRVDGMLYPRMKFGTEEGIPAGFGPQEHGADRHRGAPQSAGWTLRRSARAARGGLPRCHDAVRVR